MESTLNTKFRKYYKAGNYRGFYKVNERTRKFSRAVILTFTNGQKTIHASGMFIEEALANGFKEIDSYHSRLQHKKYDLQLA